MITRKIFFLILFCGLAVGMALPAGAACTSNWPPYNFELMVGQSVCLSVCPGDFPPPLMLRGNHTGEQNIPVLIFESGCGTQTHCNSDPTCAPLCVPVWPFPQVPDPYDYCPTGYYGHTACVEFVVCFDHDEFWSLTVLNVTGNGGCFCLTYDHQLPVNLRSALAAVPGDREVQLTWATGSEANNARFEIFRGENRVASIPGLINSTVGRDYTWTDDRVVNGVTYNYVLKSVDVSGNTAELGTASATPRANPAAVTEYALFQNYPNPFNPTTSIAFDVVEPSHVTLKVYNPMGMEVATLVNGPVAAGHQAINFDASRCTSGLYFYTIQIGDRFTAARKMLLVK